MASEAQMNQLQSLYIAYFGRPTDAAGVTYWTPIIDGGTSFDEIAGRFMESDEFTATSSDLNDVVTAAYANGLGRDAGTEEVAFWVGQIEAGNATVASLLDAFRSTDDATDKQTLENKIVVANAYTAAAVAGASFDSAASVALLAGVDSTQASVDAALGEIGQGAEPSTPTEALENLQAAHADKAEFLKDAAEIDFVEAAAGATTEAKIAQAVVGADAAVAGINVNGAPVYAVNDSVGVKAAKVADAQTALNKNLSDENKVLDAAKAEVAKVAGLTSAIDLFNARVATQETTGAALTAATAEQAAAEASYESLTSTAITIGADGLVGGILVANATTGRLELAPNITETTNPGVGALLTAVQARVDATATNAAAVAAIESAQIAIGYLDFAAGTKDAIGAAFVPPLNPADAAKLTQAQVQVELNEQSAAAQTAATAAGTTLTFDPATGEITTPDLTTDTGGVNDAFNDAKAAFNDLNTAVNDFETDALAGGVNTPLTDDQLGAQADVVAAEEAITALTDALAALNAAQEVAAELADLNQAIVDAEAVFEDLGVEVPVTIEGTVIGTAENDLYLLSDNAGTLVNFSAQGEDSIYVGSDFNLVTLGATETITQRIGDAALLEIFAKQNGSNVDLYVEQETFAGNGTTQADIVVITLSGMNVSDLVLADGFLTVA